MANKTIFISYSADDPDWPAAQVRALALNIQSRGCEVLLDQFYREQCGRRLSDAEWMQWMELALENADHVLCLCSPRYLRASRRELGDVFGRGVAMESLDIIYRLYEQKGHNQGWVWTLLCTGHSRSEVVPRRLVADCPHYTLPTDNDELLDHLSAPPDSLTPDIGDKSAAATTASNSPSTTNELNPQRNLAGHKRATSEHLKVAGPFWNALSSDPEVFDIPPASSALVSPAAFVEWLSNAEVDMAREAMWAARRALEIANRASLSLEQAKADRDAAVAVYLLAAVRMVDVAAGRKAGVHEVPRFGGERANVHLYCAVISTALAGGRLRFEEPSTAANPRPANTFGLRLEGDNTDALFERALYNEVFHTQGAVTQALLDSPLSTDAGGERDKLIARLNTVRRGNREALTLVIHGSTVPMTQSPSLARQFDVPVFICSDAAAGALMGMTHGELVAEINEFWSELARLEGQSTEPIPRDHATAELDAVLAKFREAVEQLAKPDHKSAMLGHVADLSEAARLPAPDRSGRAKQAIEGIESLSKLGESSEKLMALTVKVYEFLRPWLQ